MIYQWQIALINEGGAEKRAYLFHGDGSFQWLCKSRPLAKGNTRESATNALIVKYDCSVFVEKKES